MQPSYQKLRDYLLEEKQFDHHGFGVSAEQYFQNQQLAIDTFNGKYAHPIEWNTYNAAQSECIERLNLFIENPALAFFRVAVYIASAELDDGMPIEEAAKLALAFFLMMWHRQFIPGGRITYGAAHPSNKVSLINCTTVELEDDSIEAIYKADYTIAKVESRGEGTGIDISPLRPKGAVVNNAAKTTSGAISWGKRFDNTTATVAQKGRRGALLISLKIKHPEALEFIRVKSDLKVINDANISLQITNDFMEAYLNDGDWTFEWTSPDGKQTIVGETMKAREVMRMLSEFSSKYAEPGLQYYDTARYFSNSDYLGYPIISTNACSEQWLTHLDSCVLGHQNFFGLPTDPSALEVVETNAYYVSWFLDNVVTKQIVDDRSPLPGSKEKSELLRRIGAGHTGFADYVARMGYAYDSENALYIAYYLAKAHAKGAYKRSIEAGRIKGSFPAWDASKAKEMPFLQTLILEGVLDDYPETLRNVCCITVAPVGTGMLMVQGGGNGIEPILYFYGWRRTRVSGEWHWYFDINPFVYNLVPAEVASELRWHVQRINELPAGLERFGYEDAAITILNAHLDTSVHKFSHQIDALKKVELMGVFQKFTDSSISVTYNLPREATVELIEQVYVEAWKQKLKGVAIYREDPENREPIFQFERPTTYNYNYTEPANTPDERGLVPKRPQTLSGVTDKVTAEGYKFYFIWNTDESGKLIEVFVQTNEHEPKINTESAQSALIALFLDRGVPSSVIDSQLQQSKRQAGYVRIARLVSIGLRCGITPASIVNALESIEVPVSSYIFHLRRGLAQYATTTTTARCPQCGEYALIKTAGCEQCSNCGYSKC